MLDEKRRLSPGTCLGHGGEEIRGDGIAIGYSDFGVETAWSQSFSQDRSFAFRSPPASF